MVRVLLAIFIVTSVNDLVLYAVNAMQLKNVILVSTFASVFITARKIFSRDVFVLTAVLAISLVAVAVGLSNGNRLDYVLQEAVSVASALLLPLMVNMYGGDDERRWRFVESALLCSLFMMIMFKASFVLYQMGMLAGGIFDILFGNLQSRGEVDGIFRLNTGTQLLMLYGLLLCFVRMLIGGNGHRIVYILFCLLFAVDLFIASSRFFTLISPLLLAFTLVFSGVRISKRAFLIIVSIGAALSIWLVMEIYGARVAVVDDGDSIRNEQMMALTDEILRSPFLGGGAGYHHPTLIRSDDTPFIYEIQVLSFIMQYGLLGTLLYIAVFSYLIVPNARKGMMWPALFFVLVFFAASMFNPYMLGTYAGLSIVAINLVLRILRMNLQKIAT